MRQNEKKMFPDDIKELIEQFRHALFLSAETGKEADYSFIDKIIKKYSAEELDSFNLLYVLVHGYYSCWEPEPYDIEPIRKFLKAGMNPNYMDEYGNSPFFATTKSHNTELVQLFIDSGADVNLQDKYGHRALDEEMYSFDVVKLLIESGAEYNYLFERGETGPFYSPLRAVKEVKRLYDEDYADPSSQQYELTDLAQKMSDWKSKEIKKVADYLESLNAIDEYHDYEEFFPPHIPPVPKKDRFRGRLKKRGKEPGELGELTIMGRTFRFRWIPPGEFMMGSPETEPERKPDERLHKVKLTQGFWMQETPVTQEMFLYVMNELRCSYSDAGPNELDPNTKDYPVDSVMWTTAKEFCRKLNELSNGRYNFRLPTEAEWEYACRAGTTSAFYWGDVHDGTNANTNGEYPYGTDVKGPKVGKPCPVGSYPPNPWGLLDMCGNITEWVEDWYSYYPETDEVVVDPVGQMAPETDHDLKSTKSGSFQSPCEADRCAMRDGMCKDDPTDDQGFRVVVSPIVINEDFDAEE